MIYLAKQSGAIDFDARNSMPRTLAAFRDNLPQAVDLDTLSTRFLAVVEESMQPDHTSLWLRESKK